MNRAIGIFTCWIALFAPGILLIYGVMPWWGVFRRFQIYRRSAMLTQHVRQQVIRRPSAQAVCYQW